MRGLTCGDAGKKVKEIKKKETAATAGAGGPKGKGNIGELYSLHCFGVCDYSRLGLCHHPSTPRSIPGM